MTNITISGYVVAVTHKSILLEDDSTGMEAWYSRRFYDKIDAQSI
jgi:hypothetical protein